MTEAMIFGEIINIKNGKVTYRYPATDFSEIVSKEKLIKWKNEESQKLEDEIVEKMKKLSEIEKDYEFLFISRIKEEKMHESIE